MEKGRRARVEEEVLMEDREHDLAQRHESPENAQSRHRSEHRDEAVILPAETEPGCAEERYAEADTQQQDATDIFCGRSLTGVIEDIQGACP